METCFILSELDLTSSPAGLSKLRKYLQQFSFREHPYSSKEETVSYDQNIANAEENWRKFEEAKHVPSIVEVSNEPYKWLRLSGEIKIEKRGHLIQLFLYPVSRTKAAVSVAFNKSVYNAIHSFKPYTEGVIDLNVKHDFIALLLMIATSFSPTAFALKKLVGLEDLALHLRPEYVHNWLVAPTQDSIRRWQFQLVGIRNEMVNRQLVESKWSSDGMFESSSGYIILDRIAFGS